jgi:hypothetical protein
MRHLFGQAHMEEDRLKSEIQNGCQEAFSNNFSLKNDTFAYSSPW